MVPPVDAVTMVSVASLLLVLGAMAVLGVLAARRAPEAWARPLRRIARANGWRYDEEAPPRLLERFGPFSPLRQARPKKADVFAQEAKGDDGELRVEHVITGRAFHHHFHMFQSTWTVPDEVRRRDGGPAVRRHTACAVLMPERAAGPLQLRRRERLPERRRRAPSDLDAGDRHFRARFLLTAGSHEFAREVLPPRATRFLTRSRMDWEWRGSWLVVHWEGRFKSRDCLRALRRIMVYTRLLPEAYRAPPPQFVLDEETDARDTQDAARHGHPA